MNITTYSSNVAADYAAHRRAHTRVLDELTAGLQRTSSVLEVGCGTGNYISAIHDRIECLCVGIDPSPHMLAVLNARAPLVRAFVGSGEHLAVPDNTFDLLFSVDVVHHLVDRRAAFRQAFRAIKPGGRVCVVTDSEWIIRNRSPLSVKIGPGQIRSSVTWARCVGLASRACGSGIRSLITPRSSSSPS